VSPIFSRFFRSSLDFKYFLGLIRGNLVYHKVIVPQSITMTIYAISVFGTSMSLPITLIIFKYSTKIQVRTRKIFWIQTFLTLPLNFGNLNFQNFYSEIWSQNFDFWPKVWCLTKNFIFDQNYDFWPKFLFLAKIFIFDQNVYFWPKVWFLNIFFLFLNIYFLFLNIFFYFWPKVWFLTLNFPVLKNFIRKF